MRTIKLTILIFSLIFVLYTLTLAFLPNDFLEQGYAAVSDADWVYLDRVGFNNEWVVFLVTMATAIIVRRFSPHFLLKFFVFLIAWAFTIAVNAYIGYYRMKMSVFGIPYFFISCILNYIFAVVLSLPFVFLPPNPKNKKPENKVLNA